MSEENQVDTNEVTEQSSADEVASMVNEDQFDWVLDKYKAEGRSIEESAFEQAKAYNELQGRFGSFTGKPEEYTINTSEALTEGGFELDTEHPLYEEIVSFASDSNMNQEGFDKMVELFGMVEMSEQQAYDEMANEEFARLGDNAQNRLENLSKWANVNLPPDMMEAFEGMAVTADAVQLMEKMIAMTRSAPMEPNAAPAPAVDDAALREMQFATDEHGNRLMAVDPQYRKKVEDAMARAYPGSNNNMVG